MVYDRGNRLVTPSALNPGVVMLLDDVITKRRTIFGAAARVRETIPRARMRA
jgi:hypothetical protein